MEQLTIERLHDNLTRLKLTRVAEILDDIVDQAKDKWISCLSFLDHLLEEEVAAKEGPHKSLGCHENRRASGG